MEPSATKSEPNDVVPAAATESFVAIIADQKPLVAVPEAHKRAMPSQPLGELPDIRPATLWSSFVQVIRRATSSLLISMFARSD
jgi:hypothetical protein